jgi:hypothetical protein
MRNEKAQTVTISLISPNGIESEIPITIREIDAKYFVTGSRTREGRLRAIIENLPNDSTTQKVMIDLYRNLVLGNFTTLDGKRGKAERETLDKLYPEQGTLPDFDIQNMPNAGGMIVQNIRKEQNAERESYRILGGILTQLLKVGFLDKPKMQSNSVFITNFV